MLPSGSCLAAVPQHTLGKRMQTAHLATVCLCTRQETRPDLRATAGDKGFLRYRDRFGIRAVLAEDPTRRTASDLTWQARERLLASADLAGAGDRGGGHGGGHGAEPDRAA